MQLKDKVRGTRTEKKCGQELTIPQMKKGPAAPHKVNTWTN